MIPPPLPTLAEAAAAIASGETTPEALAEAALARVAALEPSLHAFITVTAERARACAARAGGEIRAGRRRGPLHGVPYALKDIYDVEGVRTTAHSRLLADNVASADADATERLEAAGMVLVGKLSTHEFARGGPTDALPWPNARNPWDTARFAGGSSSGSAVAVSSGMVALAMGTDTGGSVRIPASCCNLVGLKPTYGRLSRRGIVPLSFSLDHAGPLVRTVEDCALAMTALAGHDPADPGSADRPAGDYLGALHSGVAGLRIGRARLYDEESGVDAEETAALDAVAAVLRDAGAEVVEVALPPRRHFDAAMWTIALAEGFAIHAHDLRRRPADYGRVTRERLMVGAFVTGAEYVQAQRLRRLLTGRVDAVLSGVDAILCAAVTGPPPRLRDVDEGPWRRQHPITGAFNASGHPALVAPAGFSSEGLPLSLQLVGRNFDEATLLRIARAHEAATAWHLRRPDVSRLAA